jgi:hypothetical protein
MKIRIFTLAVLFSLVLLLTVQESCYRKFYKVANNSDSANIGNTLQSPQNRYLILRSGSNAFHMENVVLNSDNKSLTCTLGRLPEEHSLYLASDKKKGIPFKPSKQSAVLNEVHIYTLENNRFHYDSIYTLGFNEISKIEILEKDKGRTTTSTIISTAGIAITVGAIVAIIASSQNAAPSGSCPFVSAYNGEEFITQGELYAGSVYPQLARHDYLPLSMRPVSEGKLQIKISNDQQEVQNTDLAELMVITHNQNVQMLVDENGKLYSVSKPHVPVTAISNDKNIIDAVSKQDDDLIYAYDDTSKNTHSNPVELTFNKESNSKKAKLIFNVRNSLWIDYVFNKMMEGYGIYYPEFVKRQHKKSAEQLISWINAQKIPLTVSILTNNGWQKLTDIYPVGPLSFRKTIVPVNIADIPGNTIQLKLTSGFMFWELDYAAIDFTEDHNYTIEKLLPAKALDENGKDVTAQLSAADENYLVQPVTGNIATVEYAYTSTAAENKTQTYVLHSKGFYEYVRDYKNKPEVKFLRQFKNAGALSNYSMALYKQTVNGDKSNIAKQ